MSESARLRMPEIDVLDIVARTLRQTAFWSDQSQSYIDAAEAVEQADAESLYMICPVCEETTCDEDCPLAEIRASLPSQPVVD